MGILHHRNVRYVDSVVKSDKKLLIWVKMHPILYDKTHQFHRDRKEKSKTWENIAKNLNHPSGTKCKKRWLELVKKYNETDSRHTLHEPILEKLDQLLKRDPMPNFTIDDIEEDVLAQLFSESVARQIEHIDENFMEVEAVAEDDNFNYDTSEMAYAFSLEELSPDSDFDEDFVPPRPFYVSFSTNDVSSLELYDEACSLPPPTTSMSVMDDSMEMLLDYTYQEDEDVDAYYRYFSEKVLEECDRNPYVFNNVVEALLRNVGDRLGARDDVVKLLCDKIKKSRVDSDK